LRETVKPCHTACLRQSSWLLCFLLWAACYSPDPREVEGALAKAIQAVAEGDKAELFKVIDQRARHALISIVADRRSAAQSIREGYPKENQAAALQELGDAAEANDAVDLFARRCGDDCMRSLRETLAGPRSIERDGKLVHVLTTRGGKLDLYLGSDTWYGIVWNTEELDRERDRAAAEREQIQRNAELYAFRKTLH